MQEGAIEGITKGLFPEQREFVFDGSSRIAALCSRRAGKSYACCVRLLKTALETEFVTCVYITLTLQQATQNIWGLLKKFNAQYGLECKFNETKKEVLFPNGSQLRLIGAADRGAGEKLRGGQYALCIIDECKSFRPAVLQELIDEVLTPALYDYVDPDGQPGGSLILIGTPGHVLAGVFYDATRHDTDNEGWSVHRWHVSDNVAMPHIWEGMLRDQFPDGVENAAPDKRREYLGEWVPSEELSVFNLGTRGTGKGTPLCDETVLGVYLGLGGSLALVVAGYFHHDSGLRVLYDYREYGLSLTEISRLLKQVHRKYNPEVSRVYTSEFGSSLIDRLNLQYDLDLSEAEGDSHGLVELVNTDLRDGCIEFYDGSHLFEEMKLLQWENEERKRFNHDTDHECSYAFLHVWDEVQHRFSTPAERALTPKELTLQTERESLERMARRRDNPLGGFEYGETFEI